MCYVCVALHFRLFHMTTSDCFKRENIYNIFDFHYQTMFL